MSHFANLVFDIIEEDGQTILIEKLLSRAKNIPYLCDAFGSTFYLTKKDVEGNIYKLEQAAKKLPPGCSVKELLEYELVTKSAKANESGTIGLLWLRRGMRFIYAMVQNLIIEEREKREDSMKNLAKDAYERTLRPHHNVLVAPVIKTCFAALPKRSVLLNAISNDVPMEQEITEMETTVKTLTPVLENLKQLLIDYKQITDPSKD